MRQLVADSLAAVFVPVTMAVDLSASAAVTAAPGTPADVEGLSSAGARHALPAAAAAAEPNVGEHLEAAVTV